MSSLQKVPDAERKVDFLAEHLTPRSVFGHRSGVKPLSEKLGINRQTLNSQLEKGCISSEFQSLLAKGLKFSLDWREWKDGNADEFRARYLAEHRPEVQRRTDVRIARGPRQEAVKSHVKGLAAVEIDGHQFGLGTASIEVKVSVGAPLIYGKGTTIKSGRLEVKCYPALLSRSSQKKWMSGESSVSGTKGTVLITFEGGTRDAPAWRLTAEGLSIGNIELDPDFAALEELAPDDEIAVVFGTWLSDIEEAGAPVHDAISVVEPDGSEFMEPKVELPVMIQRIIAVLRKKPLAADDCGYVELARHTLRIVEAVRG